MQANMVVLGPDTDPAPLMYYAPDAPNVTMWTQEQPTPSELGIMPELFHTHRVPSDEIIRLIAAGDRIVFFARATDKPMVVALLERAFPPHRRIEQQCIGGDGKPTTYPCSVSAWIWGEYGGPNDATH